MPGFKYVGALAGAAAEGRSHFCGFRKVPSQTTVAGNWFDLSMAAGNPKPNYYASSPLVAAVLDGFDGLFHGDAKTPYTKHLANWLLMTPTAALVGQYKLLDYLLYYPFIDGDAAGETQALVNGITLPRYVDGANVQVMAVTVAPTTGGGSFTLDYVDALGVSRTSNVISANATAANIGTLATSEQGQVSGGQCFLPLNGLGVRQITAVNVIAPLGGLLSLVLVKPIADSAIREINTAKELNFFRDAPILPRVYDGAYLNMVCNPAGSVAAGLLAGNLNFAWSDS
jgi:hypothetical protein